jgi:hypothetical protein
VKKQKAYLPNSVDPERPLYYIEVDEIAERFKEILTTEAPLSLAHPNKSYWIVEELDRNHSVHWKHSNTIYLKLERGGEDCTVKVDIDLRGDEPLKTVEGNEITLYRLMVHANWCSSDFDLARATVHAQLHREAVELMASIQHSFDGVIGHLEYDL